MHFYFNLNKLFCKIIFKLHSDQVRVMRSVRVAVLVTDVDRACNPCVDQSCHSIDDISLLIRLQRIQRSYALPLAESMCAPRNKGKSMR